MDLTNGRTLEVSIFLSKVYMGNPDSAYPIKVPLFSPDGLERRMVERVRRTVAMRTPPDMWWWEVSLTCPSTWISGPCQKYPEG